MLRFLKRVYCYHSMTGVITQPGPVECSGGKSSHLLQKFQKQISKLDIYIFSLIKYFIKQYFETFNDFTYWLAYKMFL